MRQHGRERLLEGQQVAQLLFDDVADHALGLRAQHVERIRVDGVVGRGLQRQQPDLRPVAVRDDELVAGGDRRDPFGRRPDVGPLVLRRHRFAAPQQRIAAEGDDDLRHAE